MLAIWAGHLLKGYPLTGQRWVSCSEKAEQETLWSFLKWRKEISWHLDWRM